MSQAQRDTFDNLLPMLDDQVWWGNGPLARAFATELGDGLGLLNPISNPDAGPVFAYENIDGVDVFNACGYVSWRQGVQCGGTGGGSEAYVFAIASRVAAVPEPGTLALLGLGLAGLGFTRRRKLN